MDKKKKNELVRHSFAHILAQAVLRLYPNTKVGIGPATANGFYYDFEIENNLNKKDLAKIEREMQDIILDEMPFTQIIVPKDQAYNTLLQLGQIYKTELLEVIPDDTVSFFKTGEEFLDLCRGPHVKHTGQLKHFKLTQISKHHWLNDPNRPIFQRIEGIAFATKQEFDSFLRKQKELKSRNHNQIGQKLELFGYTENKRLLWLTEGTLLKNIFRDVTKNMFLDNGSAFIDASQAIRPSKFSEKYILKEKPFYNHDQYFKIKKRGTKHLPLQVTQFEKVFITKFPSNRPSLLNTEEKTMLTSSIYSNSKYLKQQIIVAINQIHDFLTLIDLPNYRIQIAMMDESEEDILTLISEVVHDMNIRVKSVQKQTPSSKPEISFVIKDEYGRDWEMASISIDLNKENINTLKYFSTNTKALKPFIIRITFLKSFEKFLAIYLENTGGAFPLWLAPTQVQLISISKKYNEAVKRVQDLLKENNIRAKSDIANKTVQHKIRQAQLKKINYMLIIGEKEIKTNSVSVRDRDGGDLGLIKLESFIDKFHQEVLDSKKSD